MKNFFGFMTFANLFAFATICVIMVVMSIQMDQNCTGHLKRAADANTIEIATQELNVAINYLESNNLTSGYTSALYKTPDEDIEFWYNNLVACKEELSNLSEDADQLTKTNTLMKLRETLVDQGEKGTELTCPDGLSRYPDNLCWGVIFWLTFICTAVFGFMWVEFD